jgi:hypothetical protein
MRDAEQSHLKLARLLNTQQFNTSRIFLKSTAGLKALFAALRLIFGFFAPFV